MKTRGRTGHHFKVNARATLTWDRIREEKEDEWERKTEGRQVMRTRKTQALGRISTKDSRNPMTIATWDLNEERRNGRTRESLTGETLKEDGWKTEVSWREDA